MINLDFDSELRNRLRNEIEESLLTRIRFYNPNKNGISPTAKFVMEEFIHIIDEYCINLYEEDKDYDEIGEIVDGFEESLTDERFKKMYEEVEFSEEELLCIKYVGLTTRWRNYQDWAMAKEYIIYDLLLKRIVIEEFGMESIEKLIEIMDNRKGELRFQSTCKHFLQLLSDKPYVENMKEKYEQLLEEKTDEKYNYQINCGGYALRIDACIFPIGCDDINQSVSSILDRFPFVRLLGDTKLAEDEYLVFYRSYEPNDGHHFIRVEDDGTVREKESSNPPQIFNDWYKAQQTCKEAIFAVKKEHEMFNYNEFNLKYNPGKAFNFEDAITDAMLNRNNNFSYHGHEFSLKKSSDEEIFVTSNGQIVANVLTDGEGCLVEIIDGKERYVDNLSGSIKPIIRNGKLVNLQEFREGKSQSDYDEK